MTNPPIHLKSCTVKLTLSQRDRLLKFLDRCQLAGAEVPAFAQIRGVLAAAQAEPEAGGRLAGDGR